MSWAITLVNLAVIAGMGLQVAEEIDEVGLETGFESWLLMSRSHGIFVWSFLISALRLH